MKTEGAKREYDELAAVYDQRWRHYVDTSVRRTSGAIALKGDERLLDVGCGTGTLLHKLERTHPRLKLHGVDPSQEMLNVARRKCGEAVVFAEGNASQLPYPRSHFDVLTSVSTLHFFPDGQQAVSEMARVLRPGGTVVVTDWCADFLPMRFLGCWQRVSNAPLGHIHRLEELKQMLAGAGLEIEHTQRFRIRPLWGMMLVSARRAG